MSESLIGTNTVDILGTKPVEVETPKKVEEPKVVLTKKEQRRADRMAQRQSKKG